MKTLFWLFFPSFTIDVNCLCICLLSHSSFVLASSRVLIVFVVHIYICMCVGLLVLTILFALSLLLLLLIFIWKAKTCGNCARILWHIMYYRLGHVPKPCNSGQIIIGPSFTSMTHCYSLEDQAIACNFLMLYLGAAKTKI